jgi:hypothetical protein
MKTTSLISCYSTIGPAVLLLACSNDTQNTSQNTVSGLDETRQAQLLFASHQVQAGLWKPRFLPD